MFLFLESNRDNLEQMRKEISHIKEKLDTLMNRLPVEEKKLRMEGKTYFFSGGRVESKLGKRYLTVSTNDFYFRFLRNSHISAYEKLQ